MKNNHFANLLKPSSNFDAAGLAEVLDATYTKKANKTEFLTKERFAPSTLFYGHGACPRFWTMAFNGVEFVKTYDAYSVDNMQSGTDAHRRMQENFVSSEFEFEIERELTNVDPPIKCYVDAIIKNYKGHNVVIEIKTTRAEAFAYLVAKNEGREYQVIQLLLYMFLLGERYGALIYENKNDHKKLLIPVEMTPENLEKIKKVFKWMRMVRASWEAGQVLKRPYRSNSKVCSACPIKKSCFEAENGTIEIATLDYSTEKELDADSK